MSPGRVEILEFFQGNVRGADSSDVGHDLQITQLGEVLAALSYALDLVEGQPRGHGVRTGMIAVKVCQVLKLGQEKEHQAFYASILKDSGCSTNAARIYQAFGGDERAFKRDSKLVDWSNPLANVKHALHHVEPDGKLGNKLRRLASLARSGPSLADEVIEARCGRGAAIARKLGFDDEVASAIHDLDEHWDGKGGPRHLRGDEIAFLGRIIGLAQTVEVFVTAYGVTECMDMVRRRSGKWFDPEMAKAALALENDHQFWAGHSKHLAGHQDEFPIDDEALGTVNTDVDSICEAFAQIIDAKSAFTGEHSTRVAKYSKEIGLLMGLDERRLLTLYRAALLHDIGKLGVSSQILEKPGRLTEEEFAEIRKHPKMSYEVLRHVRGFERITALASAHHERLDGKGYWQGLGADQLDLDMRILSAADVFDALTAKRPYRDAMLASDALRIMEEDAGDALDPRCLDALRERYADELPMAA